MKRTLLFDLIVFVLIVAGLILYIGMLRGQAGAPSQPGSIALTDKTEKAEAQNIALRRQNIDLQMRQVWQEVQEQRNAIERDHAALEKDILAAHKLDPGKYRLDETAGALVPIAPPATTKPAAPAGKVPGLSKPGPGSTPAAQPAAPPGRPSPPPTH
jgi:hypothetical protein